MSSIQEPTVKRMPGDPQPSMDLQRSALVPKPEDPVKAASPRNPDELWAVLQQKTRASSKSRHLGQALIGAHAINKEQLERALLAQASDHAKGLRTMLGRRLVASGAIDAKQLERVIADWLGAATIDATNYQFDLQTLALISPDVAFRELVVPLMVREDLLFVLMVDINDRRLLEELRFMTQHRIVGVMAAPGTLMPTISRAYGQATTQPSPIDESTPSRVSSKELANDMLQDVSRTLVAESDVVSEADSILVRMINSLIDEAIELKASDIHIETQPEPLNVRIRFRIDGELQTHLEVDSRFRFAMVARIKIMANMDISEHRKPQDGKIDFSRFGASHTELRVVTVPTVNGLEDVVLRLLAGSKAQPLSQIGLNLQDMLNLQTLAIKPYGLILVCGPTGSGKTTTLHSLVNEINTEGRKIWTAEDPIEITQPGLRQVQMNPRIGWTFATAMRTFLRADPDVIMIGEIRDEETARIAIEASLTGHLVLSTLHTNSAAESIARLLEIGLDPFNFSDSLLAVLAQRLVRRLCTHCVTSHPAEPDEIRMLAMQYLEGVQSYNEDDLNALSKRWLQEFGVTDSSGNRTLRTFTKGACTHCEGHGFKGRLGIYELLVNSNAIRVHIRKRDAASAIRDTALKAGMKTLRQDGIEKVLQGMTALSEVVAASNL